MKKKFIQYPRMKVYQLSFISLMLVGLSACQNWHVVSSAENLLTKAFTLEEDSAGGNDQEENKDLLIIPTPQNEVPLTTLATDKPEIITITVIFDNYPYKEGLIPSWGFSAFITYKDQNVLFDTGGSGSILLTNMKKLNIDPLKVQNVVLSHQHQDHTGGLSSLLSAGADPKIYLLPSFPQTLKDQFSSQGEVIEVFPGQVIGERISTTGEMSGSPPEQALVIDTPQGLIIITGCAHPGVDKMVLAAKRHFKEEIFLVLGGFHLGNASPQRIQEIITEFQRIGVVQVAPCHCTGDTAIAQFKETFGDQFIQVGTGTVIEVDG